MRNYYGTHYSTLLQYSAGCLSVYLYIYFLPNSLYLVWCYFSWLGLVFYSCVFSYNPHSLFEMFKSTRGAAQPKK